MKRGWDPLELRSAGGTVMEGFCHEDNNSMLSTVCQLTEIHESAFAFRTFFVFACPQKGKIGKEVSRICWRY